MWPQTLEKIYKYIYLHKILLAWMWVTMAFSHLCHYIRTLIYFQAYSCNFPPLKKKKYIYSEWVAFKQMKNVDMLNRKEQNRTEHENNCVSIGNIFCSNFENLDCWKWILWWLRNFRYIIRPTQKIVEGHWENISYFFKWLV